MFGMDNAKTAFGAALDAARHRMDPVPSFRQLERYGVSELGPTAPSNTAIANMHKGMVSPEKANLEVVILLANLYGVTLSDLSPVVAERYKSARHLLTHASPWTTALSAA